MIRKINLLRINQWLPSWEPSKSKAAGSEPPDHFFVGSISLKILRKLSDVDRRKINERKKGSSNSGIQRALNQERSSKISRYIEYGYPLSSNKTISPETHTNLINPGWLPTSILINIIKPGEKRRKLGKDLTLSAAEALNISNVNNQYCLEYDDTHFDKKSTEVNILDPLEIIDGQHRLFAVDHLDDLDESYQVPVIFFYGLSQSWQAYLFWVINVEPKKINQSLAFDLYPELRNEDWLDNGEAIKVYQEHRAQELTEILWRHPLSSWQDRIELHGDRIDGHVSNASFIRSLTNSFVRRWGNEDRIGGLFGSVDKAGEIRILPWKRSQQAAFLIFIWNKLHEAVSTSNASWVKACETQYLLLNEETRKKINPHNLHPAFAGGYSLLATDQGVRAYLRVINAMTHVRYDELRLEEIELKFVGDDTTDEDVSIALKEFINHQLIYSFFDNLTKALICDEIDFRTSGTPGLTQEQVQMQSAFRGGPGYTLLEKTILIQLKKNTIHQDLAKSAEKIIEQRGWNG